MAAVAVLTGCDKCEAEKAPEKETGAIEAATAADTAKAIESEIVAVPENFKDTDIAASVNDHKITWKELNDKVAGVMKAAAERQPIPEEQLPFARDYFRKQILGQYIAITMFTDEAKRLNITVSDETRAESIKKINEAIAAREPGKTIEQIFEEYPLGAEAARKDFEDQLMIEELFKKEVTSKIEITDDEVKQVVEEATVKAEEANKKFADAEKLLADGTSFEEVVKDFSVVPNEVKLPKEQIKLRDPVMAEALEKLEPGKVSEKIQTRDGAARVKLIKTVPALDKAAAKAKIEEIREKLNQGADFAALATEFSACSSASKGGALGTFGHGQMVEEFDKAAFEQEVGVVGPIVETKFGYHIIKVTEKNKGATPAEDTVAASHILVMEAAESVDFYLLLVPAPPVPEADAVRKQLMEQKSAPATQAFRDELMKRTTITCIYPELTK